MSILTLLFRHSLLTGLMLATGNVLADQVRSIDLVDGSVVVGEIISADHGTYTIKTDRLGIITLRDSDIVAIRTTARTPGPTPSSAQVRPSNQGESLQSVRQRIMSDAALLQSVNALKDDPKIQKIRLADDGEPASCESDCHPPPTPEPPPPPHVPTVLA